ncbi:helix-turn-helix transcriptional regulator [Kineococcus sp. SYSU DK001]|uniref:helix-turn-helix transcriptional regulator n=1 Tax=Kineococcus sp. SYSU DK001 TaxID=3383122 RepID=UPI003D7CB3A5
MSATPGASTAERVLRLLELLQRRSRWTAADLAAELGVTDRSVRRDVDRLRSLGYPVPATAGAGGGYRLGAGARLPPLLLDDEEAVATAICLRVAAGGTVTGVDDAAVRTLAKLDQVMPPRLRERVRAVHAATQTLTAPGTPIDPDLLVALAHACRDHRRTRFTHRDAERTVEPVRMVTTGRRWYLVAYDLDRDDWRTFRLDRVHDVHVTTLTCPPRPHPDPDPAELVERSLTRSPYRFTARIRVHAPADTVRDLVPPEVGQVVPEAPRRCLLLVAGDDPDWIAAHTARLGFPAEVLEPAEVRDAAARLAANLTALAAPPPS